MLARLDVHVRGARVDRVLEDGLYEPDNWGVGRAILGRQLVDVDVAITQFIVHFQRDRRDLVGTPVNGIHSPQQVRLAHQRDAQRLLEAGHQFVVGDQVGGVGHAHGQSAGVGLQHQRAEAAGEGLGHQPHDGRIGIQLLQVDEGNLQALRQHVMQLLLLHYSQIRQHAAQLAAGAFLFVQRLG